MDIRFQDTWVTKSKNTRKPKDKKSYDNVGNSNVYSKESSTFNMNCKKYPLTATKCVKDKLDIVVMSRITLLQTCLG